MRVHLGARIIYSYPLYNTQRSSYMQDITYPKQINKARIITKDNTCFFAMPFSKKYDNLYNMVKNCLQGAGYSCIRVDNNSSASVPIINMILSGIATSQYVIVDVTDTNANVFYELGIAHSVKDPDCVFIIKEDASSIPFDIQHLQYIPYNKNQLYEIANELVRRLKANQYKNSLKKVLLLHQMLRHEDVDEFISYFISLFDKNNTEECVRILENEFLASKNSKELVDYIWKFNDELMRQTQLASRSKYVTVLFEVFSEVLLRCSEIDEIQQFIKEFLNKTEYGTLCEDELITYQTDLAIKFAKKTKLMPITMTWIIGYFQRSKSTKVDLNRYKLEAFLLQSTSEHVNDFIANAIVSENYHIREHMADIAGEKRLRNAENNLIIQLRQEDNRFTISSIVEALGKIGSKEALPVMKEWLMCNADDVIEKEDYFVLKHFRNALKRIDPINALKDFDKQYFHIICSKTTL